MNSGAAVNFESCAGFFVYIFHGRNVRMEAGEMKMLCGNSLMRYGFDCLSVNLATERWGRATAIRRWDS